MARLHLNREVRDSILGEHYDPTARIHWSNAHEHMGKKARAFWASHPSEVL